MLELDIALRTVSGNIELLGVLAGKFHYIPGCFEFAVLVDHPDDRVDLEIAYILKITQFKWNIFTKALYQYH